MKILLLEDDYNLADSLKEILELEGYEVDIVSTAKEAYEKTFNTKYDLYIFDINLPDENGINVLKSLRDSTDNTPAIFITALTDLNTMAKAFNVGIEDYIKKPFEVEELLIRINAKLKKNVGKIIKIKNIEYDLENKIVKKDGKIISLGEVLKNLFHELVLNLNHVVSKEKLLEVMNTNNETALRVNLSKLKNKLEVNIKNIRGEGYMIEV